MSRAKKKAPVLWMVVDVYARAVGPFATRNLAVVHRDHQNHWMQLNAPHRVVKYVPEEKKR